MGSNKHFAVFASIAIDPVSNSSLEEVVSLALEEYQSYIFTVLERNNAIALHFSVFQDESLFLYKKISRNRGNEMQFSRQKVEHSRKIKELQHGKEQVYFILLCSCPC